MSAAIEKLSLAEAMNLHHHRVECAERRYTKAKDEYYEAVTTLLAFKKQREDFVNAINATTKEQGRHG